MCCCNRCNSCDSCNSGSSGVFTQYVPVTIAYDITPISTSQTNTLNGNGSNLATNILNGRTFYNWSGYRNNDCNC